MAEKHYGARETLLKAFEHERDMAREQFILVKMLARVGDAEKLSLMLREHSGRADRAIKQAEDAKRELESLHRENRRLKRRLHLAGGEEPRPIPRSPKDTK